VRPSRVGIPQRASLGAGRAGRSAVVIAGAAALPALPDLARLLRPGLERCLREHPPGPGWSLSLRVETTLREVVDVVPPEGAEDPFAACVVEAAWALRLPPEYVRERSTFDLLLP